MFYGKKLYFILKNINVEITITIKEKLYKDLKAYCELNEVEIDDLCNDAISKELVNQKYGDIPFGVIGKKEELPKTEIDEKEIPPIPTATELTPIDGAFNSPDETGLIASMDTITSVEKVEEKKEEENKEKPKNKKRRL